MRYRVTDLRPEAADAFDQIVDSVGSPEEAARLALGIDVVRSGPKTYLVARVYWEKVGQSDLGVDLYIKP